MTNYMHTVDGIHKSGECPRKYETHKTTLDIHLAYSFKATTLPLKLCKSCDCRLIVTERSSHSAIFFRSYLTCLKNNFHAVHITVWTFFGYKYYTV